MQHYADRQGLSPLFAEFFVDVILAVDSAYRQHVKKQAEDDEKRQRRAAQRQEAELQKLGLEAGASATRGHRGS